MWVSVRMHKKGKHLFNAKLSSLQDADFLFCFAKLSAGKQFRDKTSRDGLATKFDDLSNEAFNKYKKGLKV